MIIRKLGYPKNILTAAGIENEDDFTYDDINNVIYHMENIKSKVLLLYYKHDSSLTDIAERLKLSQSQVRRRRDRGVQIFRKELVKLKIKKKISLKDQLDNQLRIIENDINTYFKMKEEYDGNK